MDKKLLNIIEALKAFNAEGVYYWLKACQKSDNLNNAECGYIINQLLQKRG
jgi:hypothetical protein